MKKFLLFFVLLILVVTTQYYSMKVGDEIRIKENLDVQLENKITIDSRAASEEEYEKEVNLSSDPFYDVELNRFGVVSNADEQEVVEE